MVVPPCTCDPGANPYDAANQEAPVPPLMERLTPPPSSVPPALPPVPSLGRNSRLTLTLLTCVIELAKQGSAARARVAQDKRRKRVIDTSRWSERAGTRKHRATQNTIYLHFGMSTGLFARISSYLSVLVANDDGTF